MVIEGRGGFARCMMSLGRDRIQFLRAAGAMVLSFLRNVTKQFKDRWASGRQKRETSTSASIEIR